MDRKSEISKRLKDLWMLESVRGHVRNERKVSLMTFEEWLRANGFDDEKIAVIVSNS